jgi:hypothetical protein
MDSIRMLLFMPGHPDELISINDVSVAFLQSDGFDEDDVRFVSYKAYKEAVEHLFRLYGPLYGQRCASKQWYITLATWLCDQGFRQCKNEPCLFINEQGFKVLLWVDDLLCRGMPKDTEEFHSALGIRFEGTEEAKQILIEENSIEYVGIRLSVDNSGELPYFSMDQYSDTADLLLQFDLGTLKERTAPSCYEMQRAQGSVSFHRVFIDKLYLGSGH